MKILIVQNSVYEDVMKTIDNIKRILSGISLNGFDFIVFPEMFTTPYEYKYFDKFKQKTDGFVINFLSNLALGSNAYIVGGTVPEYDQENIYNTAFIFDRKGNIISKYRKIHLFSIKYPNGKKFDEGNILKRGNEIVTFDTEFGKMGIEICFDIRYPEQSEELRRQGANIIFVPAAFNTYTGPLHWETTFRARAIDNQLFVIGCSPSNDSFGEYDTYGHSIAVDPYGRIISQLSEKESIMIIDVDLALVDEARNNIPIIKNKINI